MSQTPAAGRLLHTMIRVGNLESSIDFYTRILGMTLLRRDDYPNDKFTLAFLGYGDEASTSVIELTYNWGTTRYDKGNTFGHIAVAVKELYSFCEFLKNNNVVFAREPCRLENGPDEVIAFVYDPEGNMIELIARE